MVSNYIFKFLQNSCLNNFFCFTYNVVRRKDMKCFNFNTPSNNCCNPCPPKPISPNYTRYILQTVSGGVTGPTGPTGPAGAPGFTATAFFTAPSVTNAEPTLILENSYPTSQTEITLAGGNGINLTPGTYLLRFGSTVTSTNGTPPTISISVDNVVESGTIRTGVAFGSASLTGDALITIATPSILSFNVTIANELIYDENFIIISKLG